MKLLALLLVSPALGWDLLDNENSMMSQWSHMKARESCWGKDNNNIYTRSVKEAMQKCHGVDAPELELPIYKHPFRFIDTLLSDSRQNDDHYRQSFNDWSRKNNYGDSDGYYGNSRDRYNRNSMDRYYGISRDSYYGNSRDRSYDFQARQQNNRNLVETIVSMLNRGDNQYRYKRQARHGAKQQSGSNPRSQTNQASPTYQGQKLSTGDRFVEKLQYFQKQSEQMVGNFTCVMKELRVLDSHNRIDIRGMKMENEKYTMPSKWFKDQLEDNYEMCYQVSQAAQTNSQEKYSYPDGPNFTKLRAFLKCVKTENQKTCLHQDLKVKLESQFGPLQNILDQTQLSQNQLFQLFMEIFYGEEFMEFQGIF